MVVLCYFRFYCYSIAHQQSPLPFGYKPTLRLLAPALGSDLSGLLRLCCDRCLGLADLGVTTKQAAYAINLAPLVHFDSFSLGALLAFYGTKHSIRKIALPLSLLDLLAVALYGLVYVAIHAHAQGFVDLSSIQNVFSGILAGQFKEVLLYSALAFFSPA